MRQVDHADSNVQPPADGSRRADVSTRFSPLRFLIITIGGIFMAEVIAMLVLLNFQNLPYLLQTMMDATIMVLMIFPLIYYFSLRPLLLQIEKRQQAEKTLREAYDEMELRVQERTEELRLANSDLEEEINVRRRAEKALQELNEELQIQAVELEAQAAELKEQRERLVVTNNHLLFSQGRLNRAQEIAHLGSWELDLINDQLTWSDEVYRIFGQGPQEFGATYEAFLEAVHPDDRVAVDEAYSKSIREGRDTYEIEHRIVRQHTGEVRIVHEKCEHFRDENGQIIRSVGMVHDITERKKAEEGLRRFELLSDHSRDIILFMRFQDGRILEANTAAMQAYGYSHNELLTLTVQDLRAPHTQNLTADQMEQADVEGILFETVHLRKDGSTFPVEVSSQGATIGGVHTLVSIVRDITDRKRTEQALLQSEEKYRLLAENANDWIYWIKPDKNFQYISPACERVTGFAPSEFMNNPHLFIDMIHPEDRASVESHFETVREGSETHNLDYRILTKNNRIRWISHSCDPVYMPDGKYMGRNGTSRDITERKQAEEALQKSEAMLRAVLNQMPSGVTVRDASTGELILSNARSREILGDLVETTNRLSDYHGLHSDGSYYRNEEWPVFRSIATGEKVDAEEIEIERSSGSRGTLSISSAPIHDTQGQIISGVAVFHDITERKKAERELQQLNRTLQAHTASNKAMLRATNETELLDEVCKIVVEVCGHAMIWIGYAEDDQEKSVRPVANAGFEAGYLETLQITWADTERGHGPTGTAIRTGKPSSCRNMLTDPQFAPWREQALQRGYASSIVLPLITDEKVFGTMTIYSRQPDAFSPDEEKLLTDLASDLAHGIEMIRLREAHEHITAALRESEERFRLALTHAPVTVAVQNRDLRYMWAYNQQTPAVDEIIGKTDIDLFPSEADHLTALKRYVIETGENVSEQIWINGNNRRLFLDLFVEPLRNEKGEIDGVGLAAVDLTAIKLAEEALRLAHDELELRVQERTEELAIANSELLNEISERKRVEQQLRIQTTAMEAAANGMVITDCHGNIEWTNPALTQISGYESHEMIGQGMRLFRSGKHDADFYSHLWETIRSGRVWQGETTNRRKDGNFYIEEQTITPVRDGNGQISHFIAIKQDVTERKLMYAQLEESNRQLTNISMLEHQQRLLAEGLVESSVVLNMNLELDSLLDHIFEQTRRTIPYLIADIVLIKDGIARVAREWGFEDHPEARTLLFEQGDLPIHQFPTWERICATRSTKLIPDTALEAQWNPYFGMTWIRSYLAAPLIYADQIIGIINLCSDQANAFQEVMAKNLKAFAASAAVAIQNARLYEAEQQNRKVAEILSQASVALSQTLDIQHVMETILDYIQLVLPVDAALLVLSEGNDQYRIRCVRASEEQNPVMTLLNQSIDLLNEPVVKPFFERHTSTLIRDSHDLKIWAPPPEMAAMRNWLGIPLVSTDKTIGMVVAANLRANFFSQDQVELAEAVVSQAAVAMQNAWLFEQVRSGRQRLQLLSRHLVEIQENERKYIARELHDETSQALTSLKMGLHSIEQAANGQATIVQQVAGLKTLADGILEGLHRLAMNLRPASLDHLGLVEALTSLVQSTRERSGIAARFKSMGFDQKNRLTDDMESSIYRIVQESLTNIIRHAKATYADVILEWQADKIIVIVEDDGVGIDLAAARTHGQLGLVGMQERAEMLGGKLLIDSAPNAGTTLVVEIPYAN